MEHFGAENIPTGEQLGKSQVPSSLLRQGREVSGRSQTAGPGAWQGSGPVQAVSFPSFGHGGI